MAAKHVVFAGGAKRSGKLRASDRELFLWGDAANMELDSDGLARSLAVSIPPRLQDLLEIAAYVYVADQAFDRGDETGADLGARWRREIRFVLGVRDPDFWSGANIRSLLAETINFVSNDTVTFDFEPAHGAPSRDEHLPLSAGPAQWFGGATVLSFSGGLDSLAGAVEQVFDAQRDVVLVTHRAATKLDPLQRNLAEGLRAAAQRRGSERAIRHFPVWVRKTEALDRESTQRTRSFLFAALGGVVSKLTGADTLHFFENGVISLNLPVCAQVLDARATRTTHPKTLVLYERLLSTVFEAPFAVRNPFLWKTKGEIVQVIKQNGCESLIASSVSCSHTIGMKDGAPHCGVCSQCIDRRFGVLAAGAGVHDPESGYRSELFTSEPRGIEDQTMRETYVLRARDIRTMDDRTFFARFGEVARVLPALGGSAEQNARQIFELHKRHSEEVTRVLGDELARHRDAIVKGTVPPKSLLAMVFPQQGPGTTPKTKSSPTSGRERTSARVVRVLHISDTHFSTKAWDQNEVLFGLAEDVRIQREAHGPADVVVFTGDIAQSGKAAEYAAAESWLRARLLPAAAASLSSVIVVPGNHDVDRAKIKTAGKALHEHLLKGRNQDTIADVLRDPAQRKALLAGHSEWIRFANRLGGPPITTPWFSRVLDVSGIRVQVAVLCSSWCAYSDNDRGRLIIGRYQAVETLGADVADLRIAALHHPWAMLAEFDSQVLREAVMRKCDLILRGHLHVSSGEQTVRPDTTCLEVAAGASYSGSSHANAYHWLDLDLDARRARMHLRLWDGFSWISDKNAYGGRAGDGHVDFKLRSEPKSQAAKRRRPRSQPAGRR